MSDNILYKTSVTISVSLTEEEIENKIRNSLKNLKTIYSYLIYAKYKNNKLDNWLIEYSFSQQDKYNTLVVENIIDDILLSILNTKSDAKSVIAYKQPDITLMLELYRPLMSKLSLEQCERWQEIEYEDAFSICQLTMLKLYRKGYYIHKHLLKRSFENHILMELRNNKNKPEILSLEQSFHEDGNNEPLTFADILPDKNEELEREQQEDDEVLKIIFDEVKDIIIEMMGERQFEQLFRDYREKHTTAWSRKKMQQIKEKFKKLGISWDSFRRYR